MRYLSGKYADVNGVILIACLQRRQSQFYDFNNIALRHIKLIIVLHIYNKLIRSWFVIHKCVRVRVVKINYNLFICILLQIINIHLK